MGLPARGAAQRRSAGRHVGAVQGARRELRVSGEEEAAAGALLRAGDARTITAPSVTYRKDIVYTCFLRKRVHPTGGRVQLRTAPSSSTGRAQLQQALHRVSPVDAA